MQYQKTLYKKDSKGKVRILTIGANEGQVFQTSGLLEGKKVEHVSLSKGKNIGKANETTPREQAILEAKAKIKNKLDQGYFEAIEETDKEVILPMLAKSYEKECHKIDWGNCFIQKKLDGMRVLAFKEEGKVKLFSRKGKEIKTLNHIINQLENNTIPDGIYDGEAYCLELGSFQEQMKAIKKYTKGITEKINYNIYDIVIDKPYYERFKIIKSIFNES